MRKTARSVLVTGGSRGLGLAIAQRLAAAGYETITLARSDSKEIAAAIARYRAGRAGRAFVPAVRSRQDRRHPRAGPEPPQAIRSALRPGQQRCARAVGTLAMMHHSQIEEMVRLNMVSPIVLTKYVRAA